MYKMTKTYTDFDGVDRTEDFYFNLTAAEISEMQLTTDGGLDVYIKRIIDAKDNKSIILLFKDLVLKAYGIKSDDGRRFIKSEQVREEFSQTQAYSDIFMELASNEASATKFINGITPQESKQKNIPGPQS